MPGIYDITDKTYIRPADCIDEKISDQLFQKYSGVFSGQEWFVPHDLHSSSLLITIWKFDDTNPASYYLIQQTDYDHLRIKWTMPVEGRVALYSIRTFLGVSLVHEQKDAAKVWEINHNFNTEVIIFTVWVDGKAIMPVETQIVDKNNVKLTFDDPVKGEAVMIITDPAIAKGLAVSWDQLTDVPDTFPPSAHRHKVEDIDGLDNVDQLGGHTADDFVLKKHIGQLVPPLHYESATDLQPRIPVEYMPTVMHFKFSDAEGEQEANKFVINSTYPSPLYLKKVPGRKEVILDTYPVLRKVALMGNIDRNYGLPEQAVNVSSDFLFRFHVGEGLRARATDLHTLKLDCTAGRPILETRQNLKKGDVWTIKRNSLGNMGQYGLTLFETIIDTGAQSRAESNHIKDQNDVRQPFQVIGDDILGITDNKLYCKTIHKVGHFVYGDHPVTDSSGKQLIAPTNIDAVYWNPSNRLYILRSRENTYFSYKTYNPVNDEVKQMATIEYTDISPWNAFCGGFLYTLVETDDHKMQLFSDNPDNIPFFSWDLMATFGDEPFPATEGKGKLVFRVNGKLLVILNTSLNSLAVYSIAEQKRLSEIALPKIGKDIELWADNHVSISFEHQQKLSISTRPVDHPMGYAFKESIDDSMGDCNCFAIRDDGKGGLGIKTGNVFWKAVLSSDVVLSIYSHGEAIYWLKSPFAWHVSPLWSSVFDIAWESLDLTAYDEVRIGFYPGKMAELPDELFRWDNGQFVPFPSKDLPLLGQPLTAIQDIYLEGNTDFSYALWVKKGLDKVTKSGHMTQNFIIMYRKANTMYPVPIAGPGVDNAVVLKCVPDHIIIENTLNRDLNGLKLIIALAAKR